MKDLRMVNPLNFDTLNAEALQMRKTFEMIIDIKSCS